MLSIAPFCSLEVTLKMNVESFVDREALRDDEEDVEDAGDHRSTANGAEHFNDSSEEDEDDDEEAAHEVRNQAPPPFLPLVAWIYAPFLGHCVNSCSNQAFIFYRFARALSSMMKRKRRSVRNTKSDAVSENDGGEKKRNGRMNSWMRKTCI